MKYFLILNLFFFLYCKSNDIEGLTYSKEQNKKVQITWLLHSINDKQISAENQPSLSIHEELVSIFGGCNSGSGRVSISKNNIHFESLIITSKACLQNGKEMMNFETNFFQSINQITSYKLNDDSLILMGDNTKLEFIKRIPIKSKDLFKTKWKLNTILESGLAKSLIFNSSIIINLSQEEKKIFANLGCGNFEGKIHIHENHFQVSEIKKNMNDCKDSSINKQANDFLNHLLSIDNYNIEENHLTLKNKSEDISLEFISE